MSGNWLKINVIGLCLALFPPAVAAAQDEASSRSTAATLDTVVVTATRQEEKLREVTSNVTVITEEMIKKSSAQNMKQLLRQQGIEVGGSADSPGMNQIILRGMRVGVSMSGGPGDLSSGALVLLNGRRFGGGGDPLFIGLPNVERIEIIRGPAAVQYGPAAMGGVVNIITKRGGEKPEIRLEAGAGSYDLERYKFAASGQSPTGLVDFSFGAGFQNQGDDYKTGQGWVWEGSNPGQQKGFNLDVGLNPQENHRLGVSYYYSGLFGSEGPDGSSLPSYFNPGKKPEFAGLTNYDVTNRNVALTYDGSTEDKAFTWQGRFSFGTMESKIKGFAVEASEEGVDGWPAWSWSMSPPNPAQITLCENYGEGFEFVEAYPDFWMCGKDAPAGWQKTRTTTTDMKNFSATLGYDEGGLFALSGGLDYLVYEIDNERTQPEYNDFGAFLTGKLRFLDDSLIFSAGGRFDSYKLDEGAKTDSKSKSMTNFAPSVGLAYLPVEWLKLRTNYSEGFRMPNPTQLWESGIGGVTAGGWWEQKGNPELKPEKSKTWEVGLDAGYEFFNAGLTYFRSNYEDKIQGTKVGELWTYANIAGATIDGFELALSADLGQAFQQDFTLRPYINLTYLTTLRNEDYSVNEKGEPVSYSVPWQKDKGGDDTYPFVSKRAMNYGVDLVMPNIDLMANVNASYLGKQLVGLWGEGTNNPTLLYHTPGTVVGMSLEKGVWEFGDMGKMKVRAEVNNLFDKYLEYAPEYPSAGRNYYVGVVYEY